MHIHATQNIQRIQNVPTFPSTAATLQVSHPSRTVSAAVASGWSSIVGISRGSESLDDATDDAIDAEDILKSEEGTVYQGNS